MGLWPLSHQRRTHTARKIRWPETLGENHETQKTLHDGHRRVNNMSRALEHKLPDTKPARILNPRQMEPRKNPDTTFATRIPHPVTTANPKQHCERTCLLDKTPRNVTDSECIIVLSTKSVQRFLWRHRRWNHLSTKSVEHFLWRHRRWYGWVAALACPTH